VDSHGAWPNFACSGSNVCEEPFYVKKKIILSMLLCNTKGQGDQAREKTLDAARVTKEESLVEGRVQI
jgi:hypothetical protein